MQNQSIAEFHYDMDMKVLFSKLLARYKDLFIVDLKEQADDWKIRFLLRKLGSTEHDQYLNYILP